MLKNKKLLCRKSLKSRINQPPNQLIFRKAVYDDIINKFESLATSKLKKIKFNKMR